MGKSVSIRQRAYQHGGDGKGIRQAAEPQWESGRLFMQSEQQATQISSNQQTDEKWNDISIKHGINKKQGRQAGGEMGNGWYETGSTDSGQANGQAVKSWLMSNQAVDNQAGEQWWQAMNNEKQAVGMEDESSG